MQDADGTSIRGWSRRLSTRSCGAFRWRQNRCARWDFRQRSCNNSDDYDWATLAAFDREGTSARMNFECLVRADPLDGCDAVAVQAVVEFL